MLLGEDDAHSNLRILGGLELLAVGRPERDIDCDSLDIVGSLVTEVVGSRLNGFVLGNIEHEHLRIGRERVPVGVSLNAYSRLALCRKIDFCGFIGEYSRLGDYVRERDHAEQLLIADEV